MNILAADDERTALIVLRDAIMEAAPDANLYTCRDAEEALLYTKSHRVDVAFLDINMGDVNGMDLAAQLQRLNPRINIIFVTGYSEHAMDAIRLHASGYVMKPIDTDDIRRELDNLLIAVDEDAAGIMVHTFGNFDLYVDGKLVSFSLSKSKEMLAYLIDREGSSVNRRELAGILFEDQPYSQKIQDYLSKIFRNLKTSLDEAGAGAMLVKGRNQYALDLTQYESDVRALFHGSEEAKKEFKGEYMNQYSWAEATLGEIERYLSLQ